MSEHIIPDAYTSYTDGHLGIVAPNLANVEAKIGPAQGGVPGKVYTLGGPNARQQARTIFKGGKLLHAIEQAINAGSSRIHAVRIGNAQRAVGTIQGVGGVDTLKIKGPFSAAGNDHYYNVGQTINSITTGYLVGLRNPNRVVVYDSDFEVVRTITLPPEHIGQVDGVGAAGLLSQMTGLGGFYVIGYSPALRPELWKFDDEGEIDTDFTVDLSSIIPEGEHVTGMETMVGPDDSELLISTEAHLYLIEVAGGVPSILETYDYAALGIVDPDVTSITMWLDLAAQFSGEEAESYLLLLDKTAKKIYRLDGETGELDGEISFSGFIGVNDTAQGLGIDLETGKVQVSVRRPLEDVDVVLELTIDWEGDPNPTISLTGSSPILSNAYGLGGYVEDMNVTTTVRLEDRNESPATVKTYTATGGMWAVTSQLAAAIMAGGTYESELLTQSPTMLMPSGETEGSVDPTWYVALSGGTDADEPTNGEYLAGLAATVRKTDAAWIHAVGANTNALWTAILLHCDDMLVSHKAERFAILEVPVFTSTYEEDTAEYLADLQTHVDAIVSMMTTVGDRNAVILAGGAEFMDTDGSPIISQVVSAAGGTMAGLEVQQSLINKKVAGIERLVPEFGPAHIESLLAARVNCLRLKPGRGFIIAHSLTGAAPGSDYSRVNDLRAVYYGSKAAREAAQPYLGEENDKAGEGLRRLESAMARPLETMRDAGQIDDFELIITSTPNDRLLGDVHVSLGIQPRRSIEKIFNEVYLR